MFHKVIIKYDTYRSDGIVVWLNENIGKMLDGTYCSIQEVIDAFEKSSADYCVCQISDINGNSFSIYLKSKENATLLKLTWGGNV
jgi:hypothetical protein